MRTLSTTKSSSDDNQKLCKVLRVSDGILDTKHDYFECEISQFYGMLKLNANVFVFEDG